MWLFICINIYLQETKTKLKILQEQKMRGRRREEGGEGKERVCPPPFGWFTWRDEDGIYRKEKWTKGEGKILN